MIVAPTSPTSRRGAYTLIELIAVMVVVSTITVVMAPVMYSSTKALAQTSDQRASIEQVTTAMARISRMLREAPAKAGAPGTIDLTLARPSRISLRNGDKVYMTRSLLLFAKPGPNRFSRFPFSLCTNIQSFKIDYLADDGVTDARANIPAIQRFNVTIRTSDVELRTIVFPRAKRATAP